MDAPRLRPRVGPLAVADVFLADQSHHERVHSQTARLRDEKPIRFAGPQRVVGDLDQRRPDAGGDQQLSHEEDDQADAGQRRTGSCRA